MTADLVTFPLFPSATEKESGTVVQGIFHGYAENHCLIRSVKGSPASQVCLLPRKGCSSPSLDFCKWRRTHRLEEKLCFGHKQFILFQICALVDSTMMSGESCPPPTKERTDLEIFHLTYLLMIP